MDKRLLMHCLGQLDTKAPEPEMIEILYVLCTLMWYLMAL